MKWLDDWIEKKYLQKHPCKAQAIAGKCLAEGFEKGLAVVEDKALRDAIQHCEEVAENRRAMARMYEDEDEFNKEFHVLSQEEVIDQCLDCADDHENLARWLKELREFRLRKKKLIIRLKKHLDIDELKTLSDHVSYSLKNSNFIIFPEYCEVILADAVDFEIEET